MKFINYTLLLLISLTLLSCNNTDFNSLPAFSEDNILQAVIEIPAGTNHKIEYDKENGVFAIDKKNGKERIIDFLPYPGNYGFIPFTYMDPALDGDGDALDVLIIAESMPTKSVVGIIPIAILSLLDGGEIDNKIIAIPANKNLRIINATTYNSFTSSYPIVKETIESWFLNYKGKNIMQLNEWGDEKKAMEEINKWLRIK